MKWEKDMNRKFTKKEMHIVKKKDEEITARITKEIQTNQNISFSRISKDE